MILKAQLRRGMVRGLDPQNGVEASAKNTSDHNTIWICQGNSGDNQAGQGVGKRSPEDAIIFPHKSILFGK